MNLAKIFLLFIPVWLACSVPQNLWAAISGQVLELQLDARSNALANAGSALPAGASSLWGNPAGLAYLSDPEIRLSYRRDVEDLNLADLGYAAPWPLLSGTIGFGLLGFYGGTIPIDALGTQAVAQQDIVLNASYGSTLARLLGFNFPLSIGVSAKFLYSRLVDTYTGTAFAADLGVLSPLPVPGLTAGLVLKNLGTPITYDMESNPLPLTVQGGAAWSGTLSDYFRLAVMADVVLPAEQNLLGRVGLEFSVIEVLRVRGGYFLFHDTDQFSAGLGLSAQHITLDYAFLQNVLAGKHFLTISYSFAPEVQPLQSKNVLALSVASKGIALYKQGRLQEAQKAWAEALLQYPKNDNVRQYAVSAKKIQTQWAKDQNQRAADLAAQGDLIAAATIWREIVEQIPKEPMATAALARLERRTRESMAKAAALQKRGRYGQALRELDKALELQPGHADALAQRSVVLSRLHSDANQRRDLQNSSNQEAQEFIRQGEPAKALFVIRRALDASPQDPDLLKLQESITATVHQTAANWRKQGQYQKALDLWTRIMETAPNYRPARLAYQEASKSYQENILTLDEKARLAYQKASYLEAIRLFEARHQLAPEASSKEALVNAYLAQGILDYRQNRLPEAIGWWTKAQNLNPEHPNVSGYLKRARSKAKFINEIKREGTR